MEVLAFYSHTYNDKMRVALEIIGAELMKVVVFILHELVAGAPLKGVCGDKEYTFSAPCLCRARREGEKSLRKKYLLTC